MSNRPFLHFVLTLVIPIVVSGCYDRIFSPVICNDYPHAIAVHCVFDGGKVARATLPPKSSMPQREEGLVLRTLTISALNGSRLATYTATDFKATTLLRERGEFWLVTTNGLMRISAGDFKSWTSL